jgi:hypothetical protein
MVDRAYFYRNKRTGELMPEPIERWSIRTLSRASNYSKLS